MDYGMIHCFTALNETLSRDLSLKKIKQKVVGSSSAANCLLPSISGVDARVVLPVLRHHERQNP